MNINQSTINLLTNNKITVIEGFNSSGKTTLLKYLENYLINNNTNIIFFPTNRYLNLTKEQIQAMDVTNIINSKMPIQKFIEIKYDINDPFSLQEYIPNSTIHCGYLQLINFFYSIISNPNNNLTLLIDNFELNLHPLICKVILKDLSFLGKVKQIIATTCSHFDYDNYHTIVNIENILNKNY